MLKLTKEHDGKVVRLCIDRPDAMNALNQALLGRIAHELHEISKVNDVRVLVFESSGDKAFVAGADISEMKQMSAIDAEQFSRLGQFVFSMIERLSQIVIAKVQGFALGGGCELAMACDLIYASEKAKFGAT